MSKICKECANYDHKNLKYTKACGNCVTVQYKDGTESDPSNWRALPQTNADRIRAMTDEELATDLLDMFQDICEDGVPSKEWMMHWLKQPAEE